MRDRVATHRKVKPARRPVPPTADRPAVPPSAAWFDRFAWPLFAIFGIGLAVSLGLCAWAKPFWHDEVYTILGSQLTPATLWTASADSLTAAAAAGAPTR